MLFFSNVVNILIQSVNVVNKSYDSLLVKSVFLTYHFSVSRGYSIPVGREVRVSNERPVRCIRTNSLTLNLVRYNYIINM